MYTCKYAYLWSNTKKKLCLEKTNTGELYF